MASPLVAILAGVLFMLIIAVLFSSIFMFLYQARADDPSINLNNGLLSVFAYIAASLVTLAANVGNYATAILQNAPYILATLVGVGILVGLAQFNTYYQADYMQVVDSKLTTLGFPFWKSVVLPVANAFTIAFETVICWYNLAASSQRVLLFNTFNVLEQCIVIDWMLTVQAVLDTFSAFGTAFVNYVGSGFSDEFDWKSVADGLGNVVVSLVSVFTCACGDLFFLFDYIGAVVSDAHLHWAIDHTLNIATDLVAVIGTLLFKILTLAIFTVPFGCDPLLPVGQLADCMANRPPNFFQVFNTTCLAVTNLTVWGDDALEQILIEFTQNPTEDIIPNLLTPVGSLVCAPLHVAENVVDLLWHVDLIFPYTSPPVNYLLRIKIHNVIFYLFQFCDQLDFAFNQIDPTVVANIGCTLTNLLRAIIQILDFVLNLFAVTGNDVLNGYGGTEIVAYLADYDYTLIENDLEASASCLEIAGGYIYQPLADLITALVNVIAEILNILIDIFTNVKRRKRFDPSLRRFVNDTDGAIERSQHALRSSLVGRSLQTVIVDVIAPQWLILKHQIRALTIAVGNMLRFIEIASGCGPLADPFNVASWPVTAEPPIVGVFCAVGSTAENGLYTLSGVFLELPIDTIIAALSGQTVTQICSQTSITSALNLNVHFTQRFNAFLESASSILPNFFVYISAPVVSDCIAPTSNSYSTLTQLIYDAVQTVLFLVNLLVIALSALLEGIAGELGSQFCSVVITPTYDATLGRVVDVIYDFIELLVCIVATVQGSDNLGTVGDDFECFMLYMIGIFGSSDRTSTPAPPYSSCSPFTGSSFVSVLCTIFQVLSTAFSLIFTLLTDPGGFFSAVGTALASVFECLGTLIANFFTTLFDGIGAFFADFGNCIADFFTTEIPNCIASWFGSNDCCCTPQSCNDFATGSAFNGIDWSGFGNSFVTCVTNISFNPSRKRQSPLPDFLFPTVNNNTPFDLVAEAKIAGVNYCGPLQVFGMNYRFTNVPSNITVSWPEAIQAMMSFYNATSGTNTSSLPANSTLAQIPPMDYQLFVASKEFHNCIVSAMSSRVLDYFMFLEADPLSPVIPRLWLWDYFETIYALWGFGKMFYYVGLYEFQQFTAYTSVSAFSNETVTFEIWSQWAYEQGLGQDILTVRGGRWITAFIDGILYEKQGDVLVSPDKPAIGLISGLLTFVKALFGRQGALTSASKAGSTVVSLLGNLTAAVASGNNTIARRYESGQSFFELKPFVYEAMPNFTQLWERATTLHFMSRIERVRQQVLSSPSAMRQVLAPIRLVKRVQHRLAWNVLGQPADWENGVHQPNVRVLNSTREEAAFVSSNQFSLRWMLSSAISSVSSFERRYSYPVVQPNSNFANVTLCVNNACLNCTLVEDIIDDFIDLFTLCIQEAENLPVQLNGALRTDSVTQAVVGSIDPYFWKRQQDGNSSEPLQAPEVSREESFKRTSLRMYPLRPSLHARYLNHDTPEEQARLQVIRAMEARYPQLAAPGGYVNMTAIIEQRMQNASSDARKRSIGQPGSPRLTGLDKFTEASNSAATFGTYVFQWFIDFINYFLGWDLHGNLVTVANELTNRQETQSSGFTFWWNYLHQCNYYDNARCNVGRQGFGLKLGLWYTVLVMIVVLAIVFGLSQVPIIGQAASAISGYLPILFVFFGYATFQSFAYYSSPACALFSPLPIVPDCIANDVYVTLRNLYEPCVNYTLLGLPGITDDSQCPPDFGRCVYQSNFSSYYVGSESDCTTDTIYAGPNERVFVDCSAAPYFFTDGTRNLFFWLNTQQPSAYNWLASTSLSVVRQVLAITYVDSQFTFDFSASGGQADDTWRSCNKISAPNWIWMIAELGGIGGLGFGIIIISVLVLFLFCLLLFAFCWLVAIVVTKLTNYGLDVSHVTPTGRF